MDHLSGLLRFCSHETILGKFNYMKPLHLTISAETKEQAENILNALLEKN